MASSSPGPTTPAALEAQRSLDQSFVKGVAWTGVSRWSAQAVTWIATLVVARILTPTDFGIFSIAMLYLGFLALITEFGVGSAVVYLRELDNNHIAQLNSLAVLMGLAGCLLTAAAAVPMSRFFHSPQLPPVLVVMGFGFIITGFRSVPMALLQKDLQFKFLSFVEALRAIATAVLMVVLAVLGARYWTLVFGGLFGTLLATVVTLKRCRHSFRWPRIESLHQAMRFSWHVLVGNVAWYEYSNSDFLVAGRVLGQAVLGTYTLAWNLATLPIEKITTLIGSVTPGVFSATQDQNSLRRYLLRPTEAVSLLLFPVLVGVALVAPEAVRVVLGAKWEAAIVPLQLLCVYGCVRAVMPLFSQALLVTGDSRFLMWNGLVSAVVFPAAFFVSSRWGATGIAAAWIVIYPINAVPIYIRALQKIGFTVGDYMKAVWPAVHSTLTMAAAVFAVRLLLPAGVPTAVRLVVLIASGAGVYVLNVLVFHRSQVGRFSRVVALLQQR